jgi:hypothetical protein
MKRRSVGYRYADSLKYRKPIWYYSRADWGVIWTLLGVCLAVILMAVVVMKVKLQMGL